METAEKFMNHLTNFPVSLELDEDTVPGIMVNFAKKHVKRILQEKGFDPLEIYWELEKIV